MLYFLGKDSVKLETHSFVVDNNAYSRVAEQTCRIQGGEVATFRYLRVSNSVIVKNYLKFTIDYL